MKKALARNFGVNTIRVLEEKNMSRPELSVKADITKSELNLILDGRRNISYDEIFRISRALEVSIEELFLEGFEDSGYWIDKDVPLDVDNLPYEDVEFLNKVIPEVVDRFENK